MWWCGDHLLILIRRVGARCQWRLDPYSSTRNSPIRGWVWGKFCPHRIYGFGYGIASHVPVSSRGVAIGQISKKTE
jgi:hypothetical protein